MALEDDVRQKLNSAPRIRVREFSRALPGSPTTSAQVFDDVIRTIAAQNEAILMIAREVDKLRSTLGSR
jgi:hypothetical protein